jgi:SAM-dependent methyltransferase
LSASANWIAYIEAFETGLLGAETFTVPGYCAVCDRQAPFFVDYRHCFTAPDMRRIPNWREQLVCPHCHLNNRMRAAAGFLLSASKPDDILYLTEFVTPFFRVVASKRERTLGSEYLRDGTLRGATNAAGVRHEDVTCLTFPDGSFDVIGTFDVLEHVPDYRQALGEFFRCLRPGGTLIITVPFHLWSASTVTRATIDASGAITHLLPPEIHGDPLDEGGALCFYHFGWDFVDTLIRAGFEDAGLSMFWDAQLGYLGGYQFIITTTKPGVPDPSSRIWVDRCDESTIEGWADNAGPLPSIDIVLNGAWVCSLQPNIYREDLQHAGLGDGRRAFTFPLSGRLRDGDNVIAVFHAGTLLTRRVLRCGTHLGPDASGEVLSVSQERWRGDEQPEGLTWGRVMTGDSLWDIYQRAQQFHESDHIVEFGPGYGRLIKTLLQRKVPFGSFTGVDLSPARVLQLTREFGSDPRLKFAGGDVNTWRANGPIEVVLCSSTFEHLYPDCRQALMNMRSQLAEGASLFIDFIKSERAYGSFDVDARTYIRWYSREELSSLFSACGYIVKGIEECRLGIGVNGPVDRFVVIAEPATANRFG